MKLFPTLLVFGLLATTACKKSEDDVVKLPPISEWTLGGNTYQIHSTQTNSYSFGVYDTGGHQISFSFDKFPTPAGSYLILRNDTAQIPLTANTVKVGIAGPVSGNSYSSTGTENKSLDISFIDGRIKIVMPEIWVKKAYTNDSLRASANLISFY